MDPQVPYVQENQPERIKINDFMQSFTWKVQQLFSQIGKAFLQSFYIFAQN